MAVSKVALENKHEEIKEVEAIWKRIEILVEEEEDEYSNPEIFLTLPNESQSKKKARASSFLMGFYNPSQDLMSMMGQYILRRGVKRNAANDQIEALFAKADLSGQSLEEFVKNQVSPLLRAYGTVFGVVDKPRGIFANKAEEMASGMPYLSILHPLQVLDWQWDNAGKLIWFRYKQDKAKTREDAFTPPTDDEIEYVTWTTTTYYRHDQNGNEVESFEHGFGVVPIAIQAAYVIDPDHTVGKSTFFSSSRYLIMGNNLRSIADVEVMKYGSLLLAAVNDVDTSVREQPIDPDTNLREMSVKRKEEEGIVPVQDMSQKPEYLVKDIQIVDKAKERSEMYFNWAFETEATGKEASTATAPEGAPQSGIAKAYDFADMDAALYDHAMDMQAFEIQVIRIWESILKIAEQSGSSYPTSFDVRSFADKVQRIKDMKAAGYTSRTGMIESYKTLTQDITQDAALREAINNEIDAATQDPVKMAAEEAKAKANAGTF